MKILAVSDEVLDQLYDVRVKENYPDVRLIIGCGDLPYAYLEFLVSLYNVPLLYVPGNHDPQYSHRAGGYAQGGTNLDGETVYVKGLFIAGLGGCNRYGSGPNQYSEQEMLTHVYQLLPKIFLHKAIYRRRLDLLVTHSPPRGIHDDEEDQAHRGFRAINFLLEVAKPRFMLHGHTMYYKHNISSHITNYHQTQVVNIFPYRVMEINP